VDSSASNRRVRLNEVYSSLACWCAFISRSSSLRPTMALAAALSCYSLAEARSFLLPLKAGGLLTLVAFFFW